MSNNDKKDQEEKDFGWNAVFKSYTKKDLINDSVFPLIIASMVILIMNLVYNQNTLNILLELLSLILSFLPNMLVLLVAGYTILVSFYWSGIAEKIKKLKNGVKLLNDLNSSFAGALYMMIYALLISLIIKCFSLLGVCVISLYAEIINQICIFILVYFLIFSILRIKDAVIDIYNIAKTSTKD